MNRRSLFKRMFGALTAGAATFCLGDVETQVDLPCYVETVVLCDVDGKLYEWDNETDMFVEFGEQYD